MKKESQQFWWRNIPDPTVPQKPIVVCTQCGGKYIKTKARQKKCLFCIRGKPYPFYEKISTIDIL